MTAAYMLANDEYAKLQNQLEEPAFLTNRYSNGCWQCIGGSTSIL